ncbi:HAD-IIIA family hydrolase [Streptomyces sp. B6B3]|uniref:D-glycero-alpha-D-manno-heptose-1,7-bisphosphate 7-phosphatase n=1 Tax=Streptomyces sp. B6B3 TaxID=3153570 RepID=UPI00325E2AB3
MSDSRKSSPWILPASRARRTTPVPAERGVDLGVDAVLFDRDGTLIEDVPYNGDPSLVHPLPTARAALGLLRVRGIRTGVVSNQSGVARGLLTRSDVAAVRLCVESLLGAFDVWAICPHAPEDGCGCRKPAPGLVHAACDRLGVAPHRVAVVGDIAADLDAAHAAGARGVLVPTPATRRAEIDAAERTAPDLLTAVQTLLISQPVGAGNGGERSGGP